MVPRLDDVRDKFILANRSLCEVDNWADQRWSLRRSNEPDSPTPRLLQISHNAHPPSRSVPSVRAPFALACATTSAAVVAAETLNRILLLWSPTKIRCSTVGRLGTVAAGILGEVVGDVSRPWLEPFERAERPRCMSVGREDDERAVLDRWR